MRNLRVATSSGALLTVKESQMAITYDESNLMADAKKDAEGVLNTFWGSSHFPVDPVRIARELGIKVVDGYLDPDVAGALVKAAGQDPVILVNGSDSPNRKRFTVAHEIGHYVKRSAGPEDYEYVDRRDTLSSRGSDPDEVYANAFAANLLMPKDEVERFKSRAPLELAHYFGVSPEAMSYRLANLGIADRS